MIELERFESTGRDFLRLAKAAGLPDPDEVHYHPAGEELEFRWHEQKLAVVVELDDGERPCAPPEDETGPEDLPDIPF